mmetsp:Transcript_43851/g.121307  ORF Transcript_43851/g.121307 Transcript_43851/m.121307 type:complete len:1460 (-) Transcript_43851:350-4729(-)
MEDVWRNASDESSLQSLLDVLTQHFGERKRAEISCAGVDGLALVDERVAVDKLASSALTPSTACCIVPPMEHWAPIQSIRERFDPAFERWPPHINLLWPFIPEHAFSDAKPLLSRALADVGPVTIRLAEFRAFPPAKANKSAITIYLRVESQEVEQLHARLVDSFPTCVTDRAFHTHLTVAKVPPGAVEARLAELQGAWSPLCFAVDVVSLLARSGAGAFQVMALLALGLRPSPLAPTPALDCESLDVALGRVRDALVSLGCATVQDILDFSGRVGAFEKLSCVLDSADVALAFRVVERLWQLPLISARSEAQLDESVRVACARARCMRLSKGHWVIGVRLSGNHPALVHRTPTRFHFVLDNSGSMGRNTELARTCFSELVGAANGPCSLTVFMSDARLMGDAFTSASEMRKAPLPPQSRTNITEGIASALDVVKRCHIAERESENSTHHVLVLLSDGAHNSGPKPEDRLPQMGAELKQLTPRVQLSVVVVGVTRSSDTSLGMMLKQNLETVALPALQPIYFAESQQGMADVLRLMQEALADLQSSLVRVALPQCEAMDGCAGFVQAVGEPAVATMSFLAGPGERAFLYFGDAPPAAIAVDRHDIFCQPLLDARDFDVEFASASLQPLFEDVRVRRIAGDAEGVRPALFQLGELVAAIEEQISEQRTAARMGEGLVLAQAAPRSRVAQYKAMRSLMQTARELRNQLAEIDACKANDSVSQAAFLIGAKSKYGAKALRRAGAHRTTEDPAGRFQDLLVNTTETAARMRDALREDICAKLARLSSEQREQLHAALMEQLQESASKHAIAKLCSGADGGSLTPEVVAADKDLAAFLDSGAVLRPMMRVMRGMRQSYLSLQTPWEQLSEWCAAAVDAGEVCHTEYELLMYVGALGVPIEVKRRPATQMNPFAMEVPRVRPSFADTASLCCALHSSHPIVPPEGGVAIEDLLVLVDPDTPRASRLAVNSVLLREVYTSVVLCRDLHMYIGRSMLVALHAHGLLAAVQPQGQLVGAAVQDRRDLEAQLRRQHLGRAYQCAACGFGPVEHFACGDLESHHGEDVGSAQVNNACPRCQWFSRSIGDWEPWDGTVPSADGVHERESEVTAATLDVALRICYSARALFQTGEGSDFQGLCEKLSRWDESLTAADGVDHPVQLLLALAVSDDVSKDAVAEPPMLMVLNEVCARQARDELHSTAGTDEQMVVSDAQRRVAAFLRVTPASAPEAADLGTSEPNEQAVRESCRADYVLDPEAFDFERWVRVTLKPWLPALRFACRLRKCLIQRGGGWSKLAWDMEAGAHAYADVIVALQAPASHAGDLESVMRVKPEHAQRVFATMAAQAFLHQSSQSRRTAAVGGSLAEPLGDVRDGETLRKLVIDLRMTIYAQRVAAKMRQWSSVGRAMTIARARVADLDQYFDMCGSHAHGLDRPTFWGLWHAARCGKDGGVKAKAFLMKANKEFCDKYG